MGNKILQARVVCLPSGLLWGSLEGIALGKEKACSDMYLGRECWRDWWHIWIQWVRSWRRPFKQKCWPRDSQLMDASDYYNSQFSLSKNKIELSVMFMKILYLWAHLNLLMTYALTVKKAAWPSCKCEFRSNHLATARRGCANRAFCNWWGAANSVRMCTHMGRPGILQQCGTSVTWLWECIENIDGHVRIQNE